MGNIGICRESWKEHGKITIWGSIMWAAFLNKEFHGVIPSYSNCYHNGL